jgi:TRAP-type mannitol/chloroaromatic compound transport system permease small subunit
MINIVLDVAGRYVYSCPPPGTLDLSQFAWMPSLVSLVLGYAPLRGAHVRVNLLTAPTGTRTQGIIEIVCMTLTLATTAFLLRFGIEKAAEAVDFGEMAVGAHWLAIWPFRCVVSVGLIGLLLQSRRLNC